jgi:uncharacterized protein (TIGR03083 family)
MEAAVGLLREQHEELAGLLAGLDEAGWRRPSRCEGWSIADVVLHLAQTDAMALASARGTFAEHLSEVGRSIGGSASIDEGADRMVEQERGARRLRRAGPMAGGRGRAPAGAARL